jgi:hypothetical protein
MKSELLVGLLIAMALTVGAVLGFMAEQIAQPSDSDLANTTEVGVDPDAILAPRDAAFWSRDKVTAAPPAEE